MHGIEIGDVGMELLDPHDVFERGPGGGADPRRGVEDRVGLVPGGLDEMRLARIGRGHPPVPVRRHQRRQEQQVAAAHGLRLVRECGRRAGLDDRLGRFPVAVREDVDLDPAVLDDQPARRAGDDRERGAGAEMLRPDVVHHRAVQGIGQIDLRLHDIRRAEPHEVERGEQAAGDDEPGFEPQPLAAPELPLFDQGSGGDAVARLLPGHRQRGVARNEHEVARRERRRVARTRLAAQRLVVDMVDRRAVPGDGNRLEIERGARQQQPLLDDRGAGRDQRAEAPPALGLVGRHHGDGGIILVGADDAVEGGPAGGKHRLDIVEHPGCLARPLGTGGVGRAFAEHRSGDPAAVILRHVAAREHPGTGAHPRRVTDLPVAEGDG